MPIPQEKLAELEASHPDVAVISDPKGRFDIALRPPTRPEFVAWKQAVNNPARSHVATENLVRATCVYPSKSDLDALLDRYPAICDSEGAQAAIKYLTGMGAQESAKS